MRLLIGTTYLTAFCVFFSAFIASKSYSESFKICYEDQHFAPFLLDVALPDLGKRGSLPDLIDLAAKQLGMDISFIRLPWRRCQMELKNNNVDGLFSFIWTEERASWAQFPMTNGKADSRSVYISKYSIFVKNDSSVNWDGFELAPKDANIQSVPGYVTDQMLQDLGFMPVMDVQPEKAMLLILKDRLDAYVVDSVIGQRLIDQAGLTGSITTLDKPFIIQPWYVVFSKARYAQSPETIERFWSTLEKVRIEFGEELLARYSEF